jgi:hypothetical protein
LYRRDLVGGSAARPGAGDELADLDDVVLADEAVAQRFHQVAAAGGGDGCERRPAGLDADQRLADGRVVHLPA